MNCGQCREWNLKDSPLRQYGQGKCKVDPNEMMRAGRTYAAQHICTIGRFAAADPKVIARREKEQAMVL